MRLLQLSFYLSPFTIRYPFTFISGSWLRANGKYMVNSKWLMVNGLLGGVS